MTDTTNALRALASLTLRLRALVDDAQAQLDALATAQTEAKPEGVDWCDLYRFQTAMRYMDNNPKLTTEAADAMAREDIRRHEVLAAIRQAQGGEYHGGSGRTYPSLEAAREAGEFSVIGPCTFTANAPIGVVVGQAQGGGEDGR